MPTTTTRTTSPTAMCTETMTNTWNRAAMRFASAHYLDRCEMLEVVFENGNHFLVAAEAVLPVLSEAPEWDKLRISETGDVLEVPALNTVLEIPWDRIRSVADPAFRAHLADGSAERARRIGRRIRAMRLEAGLTTAALAEKVGALRQVVANLEAGKIDPPTDLIERIALVLGKRFRDFAEE